MTLAYDMFADSLIAAARDNDHEALQASLLMIHLVDGEVGFVMILERLADEATSQVPKPPDGLYCAHVTGFGMDLDGGLVTHAELPYEVRWAIEVVTHRLNGQDLRPLVAAAKRERSLAAGAIMLAFMAARPGHVRSVIF